MQHRVERLEPRRLLAGGIDATFGSATGASFDAPGATPVLLDSAVDSAGRVVLAGRSGGDDASQMFLARLHVNGQLDSGFGDGGIIHSTPKGLQRADLIAPLASGKYLVTGSTTGALSTSARLVRLRSNGSVDTTFGRSGRLQLPLTATQVLEQADGKILIVGVRTPIDPEETDADSVTYILRLHANGSLDLTYGDDGWATVGDAVVSDQFISRTTTVTSASLDAAGRAVLTITAGTQAFDSQDNPLGGSRSLYVERFLTDGTRDTTFGNEGSRAFAQDQSWTPPETSPPILSGVSIARPDGQIALAHRVATEAAASPLVTLISPTGVVPSTSADLATLVPGFTVSTSFGDGAVAALDDDSLLIAGTMTNGSTVSPAVVKLNSDLTLASAFGDNGVLVLPNASVTEASAVAVNRDGTFIAVANDQAAGERTGDAQVTRLFADDRPVITLQRVRRDENNLRINVSIRGTSAIDAATLDDNDLRLEDANGNRRKLRLVNSTTSGGTVTATYRVNHHLLDDGNYALRAIFAQISDVGDNDNAPRKIGTVVERDPTQITNQPPTRAAFNIDQSFGNGGMVRVDTGGSDSAQSVVVQDDGKIVVAGWASPAGTLSTAADSITLVRLNLDSTRDFNFSGDGVVSIPIAEGGQHGVSLPLTIASDGALLVGGRGVHRVTSAGVIDTDFADNAQALADQDVVHLAQTTAGKIITMDRAFLFHRLNADGSLDATFGDNGSVSAKGAFSGTSSAQFDIQPDGKIVGAGYIQTGTFGEWEMMVVRLNADGSIDTSFGDNGYVFTDSPVAGEYMQGQSIEIAPDGKILVAGYGSNGHCMACYLPDGTLDSSFSGDGILPSDLTTSGGSAYDLAFAQDGKIILVGNGFDEITAYRYNADGSRDTTFGNDGAARTLAVPSFDGSNFVSQGAYGVAIQNDGKIVVAGQVELQNAGGRPYYFDHSDLFVIRLNP